ncbi:type VI secretion system tube protein TssD [Bacteroides sp. 224]|uniref:type VI secretion system tube protein TssD n=1 Tax=Bacteroides sp. 224 TaxID=2302936 RepID=UPI0013D31CBD|nr:type VI secretion system tube protein TssD [Bacteroides sp. 224]NDV64646.1 type VI secretion system needle protein Hcp [Bacteroides sp. 224]
MDKLKEIASNLFSFPRIDSELTVWFLFEGKEYEISQFNIAFNQSVDFKGQPQNEVRGGRIMITLTEAVQENIYAWAMTSCARNGKIEFRSKTTNSPLKVEFMNAHCANFERTINLANGLRTVIVIYPEELMINGINFDNNWVK